MSFSVRCLSVLAFITPCLWPTAPAAADVFHDVVRGLDFAGFSFSGRRNPISGGSQLLINRNFNNTPIDFGPTDLTLSGPVVFSVDTGGRLVEGLRVSLNSQNQPVNYTFASDTGGQRTAITGSAVFDATADINNFGFYDLQFRVSSRQDVAQEGRFANTDGTTVPLDFDIGPIDISGNLFADLLAVVTDPIFEATGTLNVFQSFSGRAQRENELNVEAQRLSAKMTSGLNLSAEEVSALMGDVLAAEALGLQVPDLGFLNLSFSPGAVRAGAAVVPEPASLLLLVAGLPVVIRRRSRRAL